MNFETASDADVLAAMYLADEERSEALCNSPVWRAAEVLDAEVERRFGTGATDRLAEYNTASHMTHAEMIQTARTETGLIVEIAKGTHSCGDGPNGKMRLIGLIRKPDVPQSARCQCGRFWLKLHNTYYESMEAAAAALADSMV